MKELQLLPKTEKGFLLWILQVLEMWMLQELGSQVQEETLFPPLQSLARSIPSRKERTQLSGVVEGVQIQVRRNVEGPQTLLLLLSILSLEAM